MMWGSSCTHATQTLAVPTLANTPTRPSSTIVFTPSAPTLTKNPNPTAVATGMATVFPTANTVISNAVGFVTSDGNLWVANADGSGERRLDIKGKDFAWSPNGEWIAVLKPYELWIISPDGISERQLVSVNRAFGELQTVAWSPDSKQIAFLQTISSDKPEIATIKTVVVSNVAVTDVISVTTGYPILLAWSPDSKSIALTYNMNIKVVETENKAIHDIANSELCGGMFGDILWSPDGKWIAHSHYGNGRYGHGWVCITNLEDKNARLDVKGHATSPVWDSTGRYLYVAAVDFNPDNPPSDPDPRLLRYDVIGQKLERVVSLDNTSRDMGAYITISPDGKTLTRLTRISTGNYLFEIVNLDDLQIEKYSVTKEIYSRTWKDYIWIDSTHIMFAAEEQQYSSKIALYRLNVYSGLITQVTGLHDIERWFSKMGITW